jgi:hypothetical protein
MIRQGALDKVAGEPNWIGDTTRMRGLRWKRYMITS